MNIVIVGDGKVGAALTEHLSAEGHDDCLLLKRGNAKIKTAKRNCKPNGGLWGINGIKFSG